MVNKVERKKEDEDSGFRVLFEFLSVALREHWAKLLAAAILGVMSGLATASIVAAMSKFVSGSGAVDQIAIRFSISVAVMVIGNVISGFLLIEVSQLVAMKLRNSMSHKISRMDFQAVENVGGARLLAVLNNDIPALVQVIGMLPGVVISSTIIAACLLYLASLSILYFGVVLVGIIVGLILHKIVAVKAKQYFIQARECRDQLFKHYQTLTIGTKELFFNKECKELFLDRDFGAVSLAIKETTESGAKRFALAGVMIQITFFSIIGLVAFVLDFNVEREVITGYVLTTLFLIGPLRGLLSTVDKWALAKISAAKISELGEFSPLHDSVIPVSFDDSKGSEKHKNLDAIEFKNVIFGHGKKDKEREGFTVGPINLNFLKNEIIFIVGGNGSGKSTLLKLLTGLYSPLEGTILANGAALSYNDLASYRQCFSPIFFDFHLFKTMFFEAYDRNPEKIKSQLEKFMISPSILDPEVWDGTLPLSQGQQRRLALICSLAFDSEFYVFDEWAADQDKQFRDFFYRKLLPLLKCNGKGVVVVSHDESFFECADKIIYMDKGKVVNVNINKEAHDDGAYKNEVII